MITERQIQDMNLSGFSQVQRCVPCKPPLQLQAGFKELWSPCCSSNLNSRVGVLFSLILLSYVTVVCILRRCLLNVELSLCASGQLQYCFNGEVCSRFNTSNLQIYVGWELTLSHQFMFLILDCHLQKLKFDNVNKCCRLRWSTDKSENISENRVWCL